MTHRKVVAGTLALLFAATASMQVAAVDVGFSTKYTRQCKPLGISEAEFKKLPKRPVVGPRENVYKRVVRAQELLGEEKFQEALDILLPLEERVRGNKGDYVTVLQVLAIAYSQMEKFDKAIEYFKKAVELKVLPYRIEQQILAQLASLYMIQGNIQKAAEYIERYFKHAVKPNWRHYELLAGAYGRLDKLDKAVCPMYLAVVSWHEEQAKIKAAIAKAKAEGKEPPKVKPEKAPKSSWYAFLSAAHMQLKDYQGAAQIYKAALHYFPTEKKYWTGLSAAYALLKQTSNTFAVLSLMHRMDLMNKSGEYRNLGQHYSMLNAPYYAARTMEEGLRKGIIEAKPKHWSATASNWQLAQELRKAAAAYEKGAELDDNGKLYARAAGVYAILEDWPKVVSRAKKALEKGGLKNNELARVYMNIGRAYTNMEKYDQAIAYFKKAATIPKYGKSASGWIGYVESMKQTKEMLAQYENL